MKVNVYKDDGGPLPYHWYVDNFNLDKSPLLGKSSCASFESAIEDAKKVISQIVRDELFIAQQRIKLIEKLEFDLVSSVSGVSLTKPMKWTGPGYRGEYNCEHGVGHGNHIHGCDGCCSREDYPLRNKKKIEDVKQIEEDVKKSLREKYKYIQQKEQIEEDVNF